MKTLLSVAAVVSACFLLPFVIGTVAVSVYYWDFQHPGMWQDGSRGIAMFFGMILFFAVVTAFSDSYSSTYYD